MAANESLVSGQPSGIVYTEGACNKRMHSDESTPKSNKKPCTEGTLASAASKHIWVQIVAADGKTALNKQCDYWHIIGKAEEAMLSDCLTNKEIKVMSTFFSEDSVRVVCKNTQTVDWLKAVVKNISGPSEGHPGYLALGSKDRPPSQRFFAWIPGKKDKQLVLQLLQTCNEELDIKTFHIRTVIPKDEGATFIFGVEPKGVKWLESINFTPHCGMGTIHFRSSNVRIKDQVVVEGNIKEAEGDTDADLLEEETTEQSEPTGNSINQKSVLKERTSPDNGQDTYETNDTAKQTE